ncbi:MAG: VOC family protein [Candidatus Saccharibacteria bacterium]|nr:VOC family protein [Candidatus Saccharibacteria bacterium]
MIEILGDYEAFIAKTSKGLEDSGIQRSELAMMDHICYRVETMDRYKDVFRSLGSLANMIGEVEVAGRPIATFELDEPLSAAGWVVPYLELPAPKDGSPYPEGLEHAELVVIGDVEKFAKRHSDLPFNRKGMGKAINPELGLKIDGLSVKFHEQPLGAVVRIEDRLEQKQGL